MHDPLAWRDARLDRAETCYWRTAAGEEVDRVVEAGGRLLPIEIKASARPRMGDAAPLRSFRVRPVAPGRALAPHRQDRGVARAGASADRNASEAALAVGYRRLSQFSREFKALFGLPPSHVRSA